MPESLHSFKPRYFSIARVESVFQVNFLLSFVEVELENIQERYVQVLRSYLQHTSPHNPGRLGDLLAHIPEVRMKTFCDFREDFKVFLVADSNSSQSLVGIKDVLRPVRVKLRHNKVATKVRFEQSKKVRRDGSLKALRLWFGAILCI